MGKSLSTVLLAIGAILMVGAGAFLITTTALSDGNGDTNGSPAATESSERSVYLMNLGMT